MIPKNFTPEEVRRQAEEAGHLDWYLVQLATSELMRWSERAHRIAIERQESPGWAQPEKPLTVLKGLEDILAKYRAEIEAITKDQP
uniref:hypothetical protein n=1 Tax=Nonomuraea sp. CA-251285 TaxID=3240002 RepID=UPI003F496C02